jgi:hypothetical protein
VVVVLPSSADVDVLRRKKGNRDWTTLVLGLGVRMWRRTGSGFVSLFSVLGVVIVAVAVAVVAVVVDTVASGPAVGRAADWVFVSGSDTVVADLNPAVPIAGSLPLRSVLIAARLLWTTGTGRPCRGPVAPSRLGLAGAAGDVVVCVGGVVMTVGVDGDRSRDDMVEEPSGRDGLCTSTGDGRDLTSFSFGFVLDGGTPMRDAAVAAAALELSVSLL